MHVLVRLLLAGACAAGAASAVQAQTTGTYLPGQISPDDVHLPGIFVQRVVALTPEQAADKRIERQTVRPRAGEGA